MKVNFLLITALILSLSCYGNRSFQAERYVEIENLTIKIPTRDTVIDYKVLRQGENTALELLVRDIDDMVKTYRIDYKGPNNQSRSRAMLEEYALASIQSDILSNLPATEIPIRLVKSSCSADGDKYVAVVTLGLVKEPVFVKPHYNLYVLKRTGQQYKKIYGLKDAGVNLLKFIFRDMNHDCLPEIIDVSRPAGLSFVKVRSIGPDDSVNLVQEIGAKTVLITEPHPDELEMTVVVSDGSIQGVKEHYVWSKEGNRFVEPVPSSPDSKVVPRN